MKKFAVIGCPVEHSLSPMIHAQFAEQFSIVQSYDKINAQPNEFIAAINQFQTQGGNGLNVTVPFKLEAFKLATQLSERAQLAGAVNTLSFIQGQITGDNTDGFGLVRDLMLNLEFKLAASRILILGAGGAVRGVLGPLLAHQPQRLVVANRTALKAQQLAKDFASYGNIQGCGLDALAIDQFDLVINGTAASLSGEVPAIDVQTIQSAQLVYDMMYSPRATVFMQWANAFSAAKACDGLGMLVEQAAESFRIWHDKRPDTKAVIAKLLDRSDTSISQ